MNRQEKRWHIRIGTRGYERNSILRATELIFTFDPAAYATPHDQGLALAKDHCLRKERRLEAIVSCAAPLVPRRGAIDVGA
jgi:hypothetical protein